MKAKITITIRGMSCNFRQIRLINLKMKVWARKTLSVFKSFTMNF